MGCNGGDEAGGNPWDYLEREVQRLATKGPRNATTSLTEEFAADRVRVALAGLRNRHGGQASRGPVTPLGSVGGAAGSTACHGAVPARPVGTGSSQLAVLRTELAEYEGRLRMQEAHLEEARMQVKLASEGRAALEREVERAQDGRTRQREGRAQGWKEAALRAQLCQARLRTTEQDAAQLRVALGRKPGEGFVEAGGAWWEGLVAELMAELDVANIEAAEAAQEYKRLCKECLLAERDLADLATETAAQKSLGGARRGSWGAPASGGSVPPDFERRTAAAAVAAAAAAAPRRAAAVVSGGAVPSAAVGCGGQRGSPPQPGLLGRFAAGPRRGAPAGAAAVAA